jgi:hypothetical protein
MTSIMLNTITTELNDYFKSTVTVDVDINVGLPRLMIIESQSGKTLHNRYINKSNTSFIVPSKYLVEGGLSLILCDSSNNFNFTIMSGISAELANLLEVV